ncbi:hypothetical protein BU16DRAFT_536329 [Lophium mytilinum]|uniref:Uncharacterized protein n=1 Tax=Lophium mytilinum TaxID=390894 RepID=A0A6A6R4C0_9PEZI|nr:hypothetical protein BU16DRAFT_536329 [Lophium mytilinum]
MLNPVMLEVIKRLDTALSEYQGAITQTNQSVASPPMRDRRTVTDNDGSVTLRRMTEKEVAEHERNGGKRRVATPPGMVEIETDNSRRRVTLRRLTEEEAERERNRKQTTPIPGESLRVKVDGDGGATLRRLTEEEAAAERQRARRERRDKAGVVSDGNGLEPFGCGLDGGTREKVTLSRIVELLALLELHSDFWWTARGLKASSSSLRSISITGCCDVGEAKLAIIDIPNCLKRGLFSDGIESIYADNHRPS